MWRLPLDPFYDKMIKSKIADMKTMFADYWVDKPVLVFASNA